MKIFVTIKQVPDTAFNVKVVGKDNFDKSGCKFVMNPYDEYAVEAAVDLIGKTGGEVVVISLGSADVEGVMRHALAMGADRGILVKTDRYFLDSQIVANVLKNVIESEGLPDLILMGRNAIDSEGMQTHYRLAHLLDWSIVNEVNKIDIGDKMMVEREIEGGKEVIEVSTPCILGATKGLNEPRYPKLPDILKAKKKEIKSFNLEDFSLEPNRSASELVQLENVNERSTAKIIEGSIPEAAEILVKILKEEEKVV